MANKLYDIWWQDEINGEQSMEDDHLDGWQQTIDYIEEKSLKGKTILDFGCNQGGFLRFLYEYSPFERGVGIDLAMESIKIANERKGVLPINYEATENVSKYGEIFDMAFSTSVIYLIEDLSDHAKQIKSVLKPEGVYYSTFSDQSKNPSLRYMKEKIDKFGKTPMQLHNLDDIANAFIEEGFKVELIRVKPGKFTLINSYKDFYESVSDRMKTEYEDSYLFRFIAPKDKKEN